VHAGQTGRLTDVERRRQGAKVVSALANNFYEGEAGASKTAFSQAGAWERV
jgi:hypothetical protein